MIGDLRLKAPNLRIPLVVVAASLSGCSDPTQPSHPPFQIAFSRSESDASTDRHLYAVGADGTSPTELVPDGYCGPISWSPDGTKLLFATNTYGTATFVIDADGTGRVTLPGASFLQWSPDGTRIAFTPAPYPYEPYYPRIGLINPDGTNNTWLTDPLGNNSFGSWSPDGTRIVFSRSAPGTSDQIWLMAADGSAQTRLTSDVASDNDPLWSPDGAEIAFVRRYPSGKREIFTMNPDGSGQTQLTIATDFSVDFRSARWSPGGRRMAFTSSSGGHTQIYVMNADGSAQKALTAATFDSADPSWSPDGTQLVFSTNRDGHWQIYKMNADGANQTRFVSSASSDRFPIWRPGS